MLEEESGEQETQQQQMAKKKRPKSLTLLQYPFKSRNPGSSHPLLPPSLRPDPVHNPNLQQPAPIHAKYKPGVRSLRLDVPLETKIGITENRFSDERAREFAKGLKDIQHHHQTGGFNKKHHHATHEEECDPLDKMALGSTLIPEQSNYAVGVLKRGGSEGDSDSDDDELHIVPLDQIMQMRPQLEYLDELDQMNSQADKQARREQGLESGDSSEGSSNEEVDEEALKKKLLAKKKSEANEAKALQVSVVNSGGDGDRMGAGFRSGGPLFAPLRAAEAESPINLIHYHSEVRDLVPPSLPTFFFSFHGKLHSHLPLRFHVRQKNRKPSERKSCRLTSTNWFPFPPGLSF